MQINPARLSPVVDAIKGAAEKVNEQLDVIAPSFAPFAELWGAEADRRDKLRTPEHLKALMDAQRAHNSARSTAATASSQRRAARKASSNPLSTARRSAATADRAARKGRAQATAALKNAKAQYPATLRTRAVQAHAAHAVPAVVASYAMSTAADWATWPVSVSAGLVAVNAVGLWLGRRVVRVEVVEDGVTVEERKLLERLDPSSWVERASERGLGGTLTGTPTVGAAGITCAVRLDGTWDLAKFQAAEGQVRALLGARTALRIEIKAGERGGWAQMTFRTRSAVDGASLLWTPDRQGIGLDTGTGEVVHLPHGRKIVAGTSGAGKSVLLRAILAPYVLDPLSTVIYIDAKGEESALWSHCAREAIDPEEIAAVVAEVVAEMMARRDEMRARKVATWVATPSRPRLVVLVDEGADLIPMDDKKTPIIEPLCQVARQGRSRLVDLLWCTQKPTVGEGIPSQIIGNMSVRVVLQTAGQTETQQVMGKGWQNHMLPGPGLAYVRGTGRDEEQTPVAVWNASDDSLVTALPEREPWRLDRGAAAPPAVPATPAPAPAPAGRPALRLVKDEAETATATAPAQRTEEAAAAVDGLTENQLAVLRAVQGGATTNARIAEVTELNPGSVARAVKALDGRGLVVKAGTEIRPAGAKEVSA
ncbi:ATP-binding protein [Streptomyces cinereoruber]|uniref:ATP-binding protein n=1 Tax=Streptomyces cinereoruber TaxID=67260 RepID=UPI0036376153